MKTALTIAGSDCSGGAGIQADLKTFAAHKLFGMTVVTSVVAENTVRVISYQDIKPIIIEEQIDAIFEDIVPDAIKIGMLSCEATMEVVAKKLKQYKPPYTVIDPVMYAKNGSPLMEPAAIDTLINKVIPLSFLLTPNIPEAEKITRHQIQTLDDMRAAAKAIHHLGCKNVVVKGGHSDGDATDILYDGHNFYEFTSPRVDSKHTHGTGCTFSSAIASGLALGKPLITAVEDAKQYITNAIINAPMIGKGHGPTHHFYKLYEV